MPPTGASPSHAFTFSSPVPSKPANGPGASSSFTHAPKRPSALANSFAPADRDAVSSSDAGAGEEQGDDDVGVLNLVPSFYPRKGRRKWAGSGRSIGVSVGPVGGERVVWSRKTDNATGTGPATASASASSGPAPRLAESERLLYFAAPHHTTKALHDFYLETATLFASLQQIVAVGIRLPSAARPTGRGGARAGSVADAWNDKGQLVGMDGILGPPSAETVGHMRRLVDMYLEELGKIQDASTEPAEREKWREAYFIFFLAQTLYLPQDGRGEGLLGEEMLDWVNQVDPAPNNSLGNEILQTRHPWRHPAFWPYISRAILRGLHQPASSFLSALSAHPSPLLARLGPLVGKHLQLLPRSNNTTAYPLDHQFMAAHAQWLARFQTELATAVGGRGKGEWFKGESDGSGEEQGGVDGSKTEEELRVVLDLMQGKEAAVLEQSADWREAVGAWGVLVDVGLRRDDLPSVMKRILTDIPIPSTPDDAHTATAQHVESSLCTGKVMEALLGAHALNAWLAAHLGDVFDKLALVPDDEERFDVSLRDYFLLDYADVLQGCPQHAGLWRVVADYLGAAGEEGRVRLRSHMMRTGLRLGGGAEKDKQKRGAGEMDVFGGDGGDGGDGGMDQDRDNDDDDDNAEGPLRKKPKQDPYRHLLELRDACRELRLEGEWRDIARVAADRFVRAGEYGLGATMCLQADDAAGLGRLAERVMEVYITQGPEAYLAVLSTLPPSLLHDAPEMLRQLEQRALSGRDRRPLPGQTAATGVFAARLSFLAEFRDYLVYVQQGERGRAAIKIVDLVGAGIVPVEYRGVVLGESVGLLEDAEILFDATGSFELLRELEAVTGAAQTDATTYLGPLAAVLANRTSRAGEVNVKGMQKERGASGARDLQPAWRCLEEVRLALARNLARAMVAGFDEPF